MSVNPLQEVIETSKYSLFEFRKLAIKIKEKISQPDKFEVYDLSLSHIFRQIKLIVDRLNKDIQQINRLMELSIKEEHGIFTNKEEIKEYWNTSDYLELYILDVRSLFVWIVIYFDILTRFLSCLCKGEQKPKSRGYHQFYNDLSDYKGKEIEELYGILRGYSFFYEGIKTLRDDYVIHHPKAIYGVAMGGGSIIISLGRTKGKEIEYESISNDFLDTQVMLLKNLIRDINEFLCINLKQIPFKIIGPE